MLFLLVGTSGSTVGRRVQTGSFLVKALRSFAILIGFLVMMHGSVMSMDPHGQLVTGHDAAHDAVTDLVCDESEAMSPAARILTDSSDDLVDLPRADVREFAPEVDAPRGWRAPSVSGDSLRAMLQVFLN